MSISEWTLAMLLEESVRLRITEDEIASSEPGWRCVGCGAENEEHVTTCRCGRTPTGERITGRTTLRELAEKCEKQNMVAVLLVTPNGVMMRGFRLGAE